MQRVREVASPEMRRARASETGTERVMPGRSRRTPSTPDSRSRAVREPSGPIDLDRFEPIPVAEHEAAEAGPAGLLPLYTPAAAAELLAVRESWLRRRAAARTVACTFVGKHLRFSHADVLAIAAAGARPPGPTRRRRSPARRR